MSHSIFGIYLYWKSIGLWTEHPLLFKSGNLRGGWPLGVGSDGELGVHWSAGFRLLWEVYALRICSLSRVKGSDPWCSGGLGPCGVGHSVGRVGFHTVLILGLKGHASHLFLDIGMSETDPSLSDINESRGCWNTFGRRSELPADTDSWVPEHCVLGQHVQHFMSFVYFLAGLFF